jgi:hypothetical protein
MLKLKRGGYLRSLTSEMTNGNSARAVGAAEDIKTNSKQTIEKSFFREYNES